LLLPLIAACGSTPQGGAQTTTTPSTGETQAPAAGGAATEAPAAGGAATEAPAAGGAATEAPAAGGAATEAPAAITTGAQATAAPVAAAGGGQPTGGEFHGAYPYSLPPKGHYNTFATDAILGGSIYHDLLEMPMALYKWEQNEYVPMLATKWEIVPPDTFKVTLRQGVKWSDGANFTAKDVVATFNLLRVQSSVVWKYLASVTADGDNAVTFKMKQPSTVVQRYVLRERIRSSAVYGEWASKAEALFSKGGEPNAEELKKLRAEFEQFRPQQMVVTGPYQIDPPSITEAQLTLTKVPTAWDANTVNFDKLVLYNGETPAITPVVLSKEADYATHGFPPATEKAFQQQGVRIIRPPVYSGPALYINYAKVKALANPKVRQAIAMAINRDENGAVSLGESAKKATYMGGAPDRILERWMSKDDLGKMKKYEYNPDEAAKMLQGLGFKKNGDVWVSPEGERMEYELGFPAEFADWSAAGQNLATQLTKFGVKLTPRPVTFTQWTPDLQNGRFQLGIGAWGAGNPHPHFHYTADLLTYNPPVSPGPGMSFPLKQKTETAGEVDLSQLVVDAAAGLDEEKQKVAISKLALTFNELLPIIPLWERYGNNPALENVRVTGWPKDGDPIYNNSPYADSFVVIMILDGTLKGVKK
jgi:peptide/nickel transport system substrate-binding protein